MLVILDRNMDLCTPLHHTWTYQALVHDVLVSSVVVQPQSHVTKCPWPTIVITLLLADSTRP